MDEFADVEQVPDSICERAAGICAELEELQKEALSLSGYVGDLDSKDSASLSWHPGMQPADLAGQAISQARIAASDKLVFKPGHVYCYSCKSASCEHSQPDEFGEVFAGYRNNGQPSWQEFFNCMLAWGDDRVDQVFADRPKLLARMVGRRRLITDQFVACGRNSMTYRIIGQVIAGYFTVRGKRCAITVQVVENCERNLHVQILAPDIVREALADTPEDKRSAFYRIYDALRELRHQICETNASWRQAKGGLERQKQMERIFTQLRHVMHSIERKGRQSQRRTKHAQIRSEQERPIHKAFDDLAAASAADLYLDRARQSIIVVGRKARAHVFSKEGKHITSLTMPADKLDLRIKRKRYAHLPAADAQSFLSEATAAHE